MDRSKFHILEDGCQAFGVTLTEKQIEQFEKYYELLVEWNKVMNLTGITEFDEVMQKHFVDSVAAAEYGGDGKNKQPDRCRDRSRLSGNPAEDCLSTFAGDTFGLFEQKDQISG